MNNDKLYLIDKIQKYCDEHPVKIAFDCRDSLDNKSIEKIIERGLDEYSEGLHDLNECYLFDEESYFKKEVLVEKFKDEIREFLLKEHSEEEIEADNLVKAFILDNDIYPIVYLDVESFLKYTDIIAMLTFYSNYDCTNSFDTMESSEYMYQVHKAVKKGVSKADFIWEHMNGAYGGSLFIMPFRISLLDFLEMREKYEEATTITIPAGTPFGFYSGFQGSCSVFEKVTGKPMRLKLQYGPTEYDHIGLKADVENSYSLAQTAGYRPEDFQEITFKLK